MKKIILLPAIVLVLISISSCGTQSTQISDTTYQAIRSISDPSNKVFSAHNVLELQCLNAHGFHYPISYTTDETDNTTTSIRGIWKDQKSALLRGYDSTFSPQPDDSIEDYIANFSDEEKKVHDILVDVSQPSNCPTYAWSILFDNKKSAVVLTNSYNELYPHIRLTDSYRHDIQKLMQEKYSPCMKGYGYNVNNPTEMIKYAKEKLGTYKIDRPNAREQEMIINDYSCQDKAQLRKKIQYYERHSTDSWIASHEALILERAEKMHSAEAVANKVINGSYSYQTSLTDTRISKQEREKIQNIPSLPQ